MMARTTNCYVSGAVLSSNKWCQTANFIATAVSTRIIIAARLVL